MDLQPARQFDYLQRTLSIFLSNPSDMSSQFELLIDELIKENKQLTKSPKNSPESSSSDSKSESTTATSPPQSQPKKRSAPLLTNSKPPPTKRLKSNPIKSDDDENDDDDEEIHRKKKSISDEKRSTKNKDDESTDDDDDDDDDNDETKSKSSESQVNPSSSGRDIDEFAIELGLVCNKCKVLTEEKDNRLVECHECHVKYHQKCHKPTVSTADISDPRCLWYCSKCRKAVNKRQSQSTIKEIKPNSNSLTSTTKSKPTESTAKKGISTSITDVTPQLFSFKNKASESTTSDNPTSSISSTSTSNSSLTNGQSTVKNTNGWASLATGFKEKKSINSESASSILSELTALTSTPNSNPTKSTTPISTNSLNPLLKQSINGSTSGSLKTTSLSSLKSVKPSSPPVLKPQLSASSLKSTQKILPTNKNTQRVSSPTPLGRQPSVVKSPPSTTTPTNPPSAVNRLNSSGSHSPSSINTKMPSGIDYEKRIKQMKKQAAEKSSSKKF